MPDIIDALGIGGAEFVKGHIEIDGFWNVAKFLRDNAAELVVLELKGVETDQIPKFGWNIARELVFVKNQISEIA